MPQCHTVLSIELWSYPEPHEVTLPPFRLLVAFILVRLMIFLLLTASSLSSAYCLTLPPHPPAPLAVSQEEIWQMSMIMKLLLLLLLLVLVVQNTSMVRFQLIGPRQLQQPPHSHGVTDSFRVRISVGLNMYIHTYCTFRVRISSELYPYKYTRISATESKARSLKGRCHRICDIE